MFGIDDIVGGALDAVGDLFGNYSNAQQLAKQQKFAGESAIQADKWTREIIADQQRYNTSEAAKTRAFEERMSNSAYQRQMADIAKAGLNPIMAAMKGGGASTPNAPTASSSAVSGAKADSPSSHNMQAIRLADSIKRQMASSADIKLMHKNAEAKDSEIAFNKAATDLKNYEAQLTQVNTGKALVETDVARQRREKEKQDAYSQYLDNWIRRKGVPTELTRQEMEKVQNEVRGSKAYQYFSNWGAPIINSAKDLAVGGAAARVGLGVVKSAPWSPPKKWYVNPDGSTEKR